MDHSWGKNVSDFGLAGVGATLVSRTLGFPAFAMTNADPWDGRYIDYWYCPADMPDAVFFRVTSSDPRVGHFPYGRPVEPDVPG